MENLENVIEAIMFAVGRVITKEELEETLGENTDTVNTAVEKLLKKYSGDNGILIKKVGNGYQLVSNNKYYEYVSSFVESSKKEILSTTCLEVLSIIAYNSKITKSEIENIRGVNSDSQVARLLEYGLIEEVGRLKLPGRPAIFSVTNEFLKSMGIASVEELPDFSKMKKEKEYDKSEIEVEESIKD